MARLAQVALLLALLSLLQGGCDPERPQGLPSSVEPGLQRVSVAHEGVLDRAKQTPPREPLPFTLAPRDGGLEQSEDFPCSECHEPGDDVDVTPRAFDDEHAELKLEHGAGRIWCLDCHHPQERDSLLGDLGRTVPPAQVHLACGRCHGAIARDFQLGVHGRRESHWQGERVLLSCLACHAAHRPAIPPRKPAAGPTPRADLAPPIPLEPGPTRLDSVLKKGAGHAR